VNRNFRDEGSLQTPEDIGDIKEIVYTFDPYANRLIENLRSEEMDITDTNKNNVIIRLYLKINQLQDFIRLRWRQARK